jgi:hypothetical protein
MRRRSGLCMKRNHKVKMKTTRRVFNVLKEKYRCVLTQRYTDIKVTPEKLLCIGMNFKKGIKQGTTK